MLLFYSEFVIYFYFCLRLNNEMTPFVIVICVLIKKSQGPPDIVNTKLIVFVFQSQGSSSDQIFWQHL